MLSQLEKGASNPTINTVWKITGALHKPYTSLLALPQDHTIHIRKQDIQPLVEGKYHIFNYYPKDADRDFELYQIELEPGGHESIGHPVDSSEYIMMIEGRMELKARERSLPALPRRRFLLQCLCSPCIPEPEKPERQSGSDDLLYLTRCRRCFFKFHGLGVKRAVVGNPVQGHVSFKSGHKLPYCQWPLSRPKSCAVLVSPP